MQNVIVQIIDRFNQMILEPVMWILIGLSLIMFFWGLAFYLLPVGDEKKAEAKNHIIWGLVGLFIIFSVYGIISLIMSTVDSLV